MYNIKIFFKRKERLSEYEKNFIRDFLNKYFDIEPEFQEYIRTEDLITEMKRNVR